MTGEEPFIKRWSRLKHERRDEPKSEPEKRLGERLGDRLGKRPGDRLGERLGERPGERLKTEPAPPADAGDPDVIAKLPPIESLGEHSDYSPFMREGVPMPLRLAALRKLWTSDPALAGPELLDLHNLDYTHLAAPGQVVATSYQVGRGFVDKVEESIKRVEEARSKEEAAPAKEIAASEPPAEAKAPDSPAPAGEPEKKSPATPKREA
jgi:hypothetical protein